MWDFEHTGYENLGQWLNLIELQCPRLEHGSNDFKIIHGEDTEPTQCLEGHWGLATPGRKPRKVYEGKRVRQQPPICVFQVSSVSLVICNVGTWLPAHSLGD